MFVCHCHHGNGRPSTRDNDLTCVGTNVYLCQD